MKIQQLESLILIILMKIRKFVGMIQVMIDNNPAKSIRSIAKDMTESKRVSYQASSA